MTELPTLADLETAVPVPEEAPPPPSQAEEILAWLESEGFRCVLDDDGDLRLRHEGRDVLILLDPDDPAYVRFLLLDLWRCGGEGDERSTALVVANSVNNDLKAVKLSLHPSGSVAAAVELFLEDLEAFQKVTLRCLDLLGAARWEFRSRMRSARQKAVEAEAAIEAPVEDDPGCPDDVAGLP